jgi:hypothetical protein
VTMTFTGASIAPPTPSSRDAAGSIRDSVKNRFVVEDIKEDEFGIACDSETRTVETIEPGNVSVVAG